MVQAGERQQLAEAPALRGRVDADDVHLAERRGSAAWSSGSRAAGRRRRASSRPAGSNHGSAIRSARFGRVHRALLGVVRERRGVDPDQLVGVGRAVAADVSPSGTTSAGSGSLVGRRITHSDADPLEAVAARQRGRRRVVAVRPGADRRRRSRQRLVEQRRGRRRGPGRPGVRRGSAGRRSAARTPSSRTHERTDSGSVPQRQPGRLVERRGAVLGLGGGGDLGDRSRRSP